MTNANIPGGLEQPYPDIIILCLHRLKLISMVSLNNGLQ